MCRVSLSHAVRHAYQAYVAYVVRRTSLSAAGPLTHWSPAVRPSVRPSSRFHLLSAHAVTSVASLTYLAISYHLNLPYFLAFLSANNYFYFASLKKSRNENSPPHCSVKKKTKKKCKIILMGSNRQRSLYYSIHHVR